MPDPIHFSGSPLDRASMLRRDEAWLKERLEDSASRYLPIWRLQPLVKTGSERSLAWARQELCSAVECPPILLGLDDGVAHYALDISALEDPVAELGLADSASFEELRGLAAGIPGHEAAIAAHARALVDWHARHGYCAVCGHATQIRQGGVVRHCVDCDSEHFPRTDPVAIAAVSDGERCLLGRGHGWPGTMYSALAGFIEPGETIEEGCRREIAEEVGLEIGDVRYVVSQPWPFPSSLMIGCIAILADGAADDLTVDTVELEDARWFDRATVRAALEGNSQELFVPPPFAVAHHIIRAWASTD